MLNYSIKEKKKKKKTTCKISFTNLAMIWSRNKNKNLAMKNITRQDSKDPHESTYYGKA